MPVSLIVGPPNSGRAGEIQARLEAALDQDPVLVVPTVDDVADFEQRLCAGGATALGASIRIFHWLADDLAAATGAEARPVLSDAQRLALVRAAVRATRLSRLGASAARRGFAAALERLIGELQAALVTPGELKAAARGLEGGDQEVELARLYAAYLELRERSGRDDRHSALARVRRALAERPLDWGRRPVFLYGFDDLTEEQLALVRALAGACQVTVAINYSDREALAARARLYTQLREELGASVEVELPADPGYTESATLARLDGSLFEPDAHPVAAGAGLTLLDCGGERGEAEAVGAEIARLLRAGVEPDEILVVLRHPDAAGDLYGRVLTGLGIPVAVEASVPLSRTAVGRGLIALAGAAGPDGAATELLAFMRTRPGDSQSIADWLERSIRRGHVSSAAQAVVGWRSPPRELQRLEAAGAGAPWLRTLAGVARELAEAPHLRTAPVEAGAGEDGLAPFEPLELRAALAAAAILEQLAALEELPGLTAPSPPEAVEALEESRVALWRGPAEGRVRIVSPYRVRAARARHLFVASLNEGKFPSAGGADPLLPEDRRRALGIAPLVRRDPGEEERYLFHACVSRPTEGLWLVWRGSDEDGRPAARSPFVDDVLDLVAGDPDELIRRRGLDRMVPDPEEATSARDLARSIAGLGNDVEAARALASLGVPADTAGALAAAIDRARAMREDREEDRPGPLSDPAVLAALRARDPIGPGTLEKWLECPYRWFVEHELTPERLDPEPEHLVAGSIAHDVLERLYRDPPGEEAVPRPGDVGRWKARARELLAAAVEARDLAPERATTRIMVGRVEAHLGGFLEREAAGETTLRPLLVEVGFGEGAERPALALDPERTLHIHGRIDRVDVTPDGRDAVVFDYKSGRRVTPLAQLAAQGKLQIQLYAAAVRDLWGLRPIGGIYHPLAARPDEGARGFALRGDPATDALDLTRTDRCDEDRLAEVIDDAVARATEVAGEMRRGEIGRRPNEGRCPEFCTFQPICRLERSVGPTEATVNGEPGGNGNG